MTAMRRWLPCPRFSATLVLIWLLLNNTLYPGHILIGAVLGIVIPLLTRDLLPPLPVIRRPGKAIAFVLLVLGDIVVANLRVARLVLGPLASLRPRLVSVPLDIADPVVASILAGTVTLTPGTVSVDLDVEAGVLRVHALDAADDATVIGEIKTRYEARLREIFGC